MDPDCNLVAGECVPHDPACASHDEIAQWLEGKKAMMKILNYKIDFEDFENTTRVQNELYLPSIPISAGKFSDVGYRYRANIFDRYDNYLRVEGALEPTREKFYDYIFFNSDTFEVDPDQYNLAEIYFRLNAR